MRCGKCGQPAAVNMRRHRLALCESCYVDWLPTQVARTIERFAMFGPHDRLLVAVSGGKDSLGLWDMLLRLGYQADGMYIHLGIHHGGYSDASLECIHRFVARWAAEGVALRLHVVDVKAEQGRSIPEMVYQRRRKPCSLCGLIKRHAMNRIAYEGGYTVLATGHNLDDEAAALYQNTMHWRTGYLGRQSPVLPSIHPKLARKVKPLCLIYERESAAYTLLRGIDYIQDECPFAVDATSIFAKGLLNQVEDRSPGSKLQFYLDFLRARDEGRIVLEKLAPPEYHECRVCGQPTTVPDVCAFCRLWAAKDADALPLPDDAMEE
ncbi:MAG: adenine nucleotide alpha hydrolase family protein [Chloroflexi bacterium]|nr:adenine nucleotide alpha hydrolase family protein [Chloroflexota bacterium]